MSNPNIRNMIQHYKNPKISEQTKVREILQQAALLGLERHRFFEKAAFYGGTALRILYGLDRFSEDLDFTLLKPDPAFDFSPYLEGMQKELRAFGYAMEVSQKQKNVETNVISAFMKVNTIELYLAIENKAPPKGANPEEKIRIKLEVDIDPPPQARVENHLVLNPVSFYVLTLNIQDLFAGKMHAILYRAWKGRIKGRDWYDLIWYIQKQIPLSLCYLESCMRQAGNLPPDQYLTRNKVIDLLSQKIGRINWEDAKADIRPFIAEPERLALWSPIFFSDLIQHLKIAAD